MRQTNMPKKYGLYIDGKWRDAADGGVFDVYSPASGEKLALCAQATNSDVDAAAQAGWKAFPAWKRTSPAERAAILNKVADIIEANKEYLSAIETMDNGKPIRESLTADIPGGAEHFRYFAGAILTEEGYATMLSDNLLSIVLREPLGVVGQIVPWNFPFLMAAWKIAPALAAGCCVVFKPSSHTSLSVLELARLTQEALPPGVFNVITGAGAKSGAYMLESPALRKLAFTGSTEIGRDVARGAAENLIPVTLELGGKSANIFFDDCNMDIAIDGVQLGILFNQGQTCSAGSRIFVQEGIYDRFIDKIVSAFNKIKVGDPLNTHTQMGPLIYEQHLQNVLNYIEIGKREGARVACGGFRLTEGDLAKGLFMQPTLLTDVSNDMRVAREEIFGPVAVAIKFKDEEELIHLANDSPYGLGGAVWTQDINRAIRVAREVETGRMWINTYGAVPAGAPFGGCKKSGYGRETHKAVLSAYTQMKSIMVNLKQTPSPYYI
jgi:acyl-CoA reductase-like NAD-dependent aldehyde dehydrogenase